MLKFSLGTFLLLIILGIFIWKEKASIQENIIIEHLNKVSEPNFEARYSLKTRGFPNRTDTEVQKLKIIESNRKKELMVNRILVMSLIYNSDKYIINIKPPLELKINGTVLTIPRGILEIGISRKNSTFTLHGRDLIVHINGNDLLTIKDLILATRLGKEPPPDLEIFIKIEELYINRIDNDPRAEENLVFNFALSKDLIESLDLKKIPFLGGKITKPGSTTKVTLEVIKTNLNTNKDVYDLPFILRELLNSSQVYH